MRILFTTTAGHGHFRPLVPFASAAVRAGHDVIVAAPTSFQAAIRAEGFAFRPLGEAARENAQAVFTRAHTASFQDGNTIVLRDGFGGVYARAALPAMLELVDDWAPDVLVRESLEFAGLVAAEAREVPHVQIAMALVAEIDNVSAIVADRLCELHAEQGMAPGDFPIGVDEPIWTLTPPSLEPTDRARAHRFQGIEATPRTRRRGRPLVYVTFGTEAPRSFFPDLYRATIDALNGLELDILVALGGADPEQLPRLPSSVRVERWVDQDKILAGADLTICHGGYGTTIGSLAAGVPLVVLPLFSEDQWLNAAAVAKTGAGIALRGPDDVDNLRAAVIEVLGSESRRSRARAIADEIASLPAADEAIASLRVPRRAAALR